MTETPTPQPGYPKIFTTKCGVVVELHRPAREIIADLDKMLNSAVLPPAMPPATQGRRKHQDTDK